MNILITGSKGFVGKNLLNFINDNFDHNIIEYCKNESLKDLESKIKISDFIIHLAAVNRPKDDNLFEEVNVNLNKKICKVLIENNLQTPIIFSSSTQSTLENPYGLSKLKGERIFSDLNKNNKNPIFLYKLPGIFGKWCKPNYNSVVSTFCFNTINDLEISITDHTKEITLVYIDDVIKSFCSNFENKKNGTFEIDIKPSYKITLGDLAQKIATFNFNRENLIIDNVGKGFDRKLYATFMSFINIEKFDYPLKEYKDKRGKFVEFLKNENSGQVAYFTAHPGITRGGHYHNTKSEKFVVIDGKARFKFKNLKNKQKIVIYADSENPKVVDSIPGWVHDITNIGNSELKVILWSSEIFDRKNPDTYQKEV